MKDQPAKGYAMAAIPFPRLPPPLNPSELRPEELRMLALAGQYLTNALIVQLIASGVTVGKPEETWGAVTPAMFARAALCAVAAAIATDQPLSDVAQRAESDRN